jgi:hypothetical protein
LVLRCLDIYTPRRTAALIAPAVADTRPGLEGVGERGAARRAGPNAENPACPVDDEGLDAVAAALVADAVHG